MLTLKTVRKKFFDQKFWAGFWLFAARVGKLGRVLDTTSFMPR